MDQVKSSETAVIESTKLSVAVFATSVVLLGTHVDFTSFGMFSYAFKLLMP